MIPVVTLDKEGKVIGQQAFNDNLTAVEELNRVLLATVFGAQQKLTNLKHAVDKKVMAGAYTEAQLATLLSAAETLHTAIQGAMSTFEAALEA